MSHIPARILGAAATVALVIAPVATASSAGAVAKAAPRHTLAMEFADVVGGVIGAFAEADGVDGRSTSSVRGVVQALKTGGDDLLNVTITGLSDRNHDGLDDDAKIQVRIFDNLGTVTLRKNRTYTVTDGGFVFRNKRAVLKESAQSFDRIMRLATSQGAGDTWDMEGISLIKGEMPVGVRVVSDYDGNHDGYDDDGRLTFLSRGKAVTLTLGNTNTQVGKVTYGPTWKTKAPNRVHHPVKPTRPASASMFK